MARASSNISLTLSTSTKLRWDIAANTLSFRFSALASTAREGEERP